MKCPKCHYVSFEPEPRCRHCGYGFSLADAERAASLSDSDDSGEEEPLVAVGPAPARTRAAMPFASSPRPARLELPAPPQAPAPHRAPAASTTGVLDEIRPAAAPAVPPWEQELVRTPPPATTELPLFVRAVSAGLGQRSPFEAAPDEPLVRVPVEPRAPLSVRRGAPDLAAEIASLPQPRAGARKLGPLDRDLLEDLQRIELAELTARTRAGRRDPSLADRVGPGVRLAAAALDALIIGGLSAGVLWITLRWCDLPVEQALTLPLLPTAAFHALVSLGYLLMFTAAGGQTIGKMAFGLRVVGDAEGPPDFPAVTLSQATWRVMLSLPSVLALGAGFLPALVGSERAVHDRLAHTRVVRA